MPKIEQKNRIFFSSEILLFLATILALVVANFGNFEFYREFFKSDFAIPFLNLKNISLKFIIDDCLMVIFFILIGLELKKEIIIGELSSKDKIIFPMLASLGGSILPALIFYKINLNEAQNLAGFAIPTATDIAFTYAIIKIFGNKIPAALKIFIITLAVADDLLAVGLIAFFYTANLNIFYIFLSSIMLLILAFLNLAQVKKIEIYCLFGIILWFFILRSGIHPTIAGVILALFIPYQINEKFLLNNFAKTISPLVNFIILPIFAFANAGIKFLDFSLMTFLDPLVIGIALGLFIGKQGGIMISSYFLIKFKLCSLPKNTDWLQFYAVAILAGIGFTMSLFIGNLAFFDAEILEKVKIGVLSGSFISLVVGSIFLICFKKIRNANLKITV